MTVSCRIEAAAHTTENIASSEDEIQRQHGDHALVVAEPSSQPKYPIRSSLEFVQIEYSCWQEAQSKVINHAKL